MSTVSRMLDVFIQEGTHNIWYCRVAPGVEEDEEAVEDLKAWLQDHNGDNWDADNDEGKMHKVRLEDDVCGDGSQHEMAVWRYKDPAPTGCSAHIAQGLIDLAVAAAGDATSDSGDVLDIITSGDCLYLSWKRNLQCSLCLLSMFYL